MRNFVNKVNDTAPLASGILDAQEDNVRNEELENLVTAGSINLDAPTGPDTRTNMMAESVTRHVGAALACTDSGSANAYVLALIGNFVAPSALVAELRIRFRPGHANTTASTLNAFGLGSKPIVQHTLAAFSGGELIAGREAEAIYRPDVGASGSWVLPAWANANYVNPAPASPTEIGTGEGWSVDSGTNTGNLNFGGLTNLATLANTDIFARYVAGVGHRGVTKAQLAAALSSGGGIKGVQVITTSSTYTKTAGTNTALVIAVAGGGGGNGGATQNGAGGGAGGTAIAYVDLSGVSTVACVIGAGGTAGNEGSGGNGGTTSFGSYAVATGGGGATWQVRLDSYGEHIPGAGGRGTTGLLLLGGQGGNIGGVGGGTGGSSFLGGGGRGGNAVAYSNMAGSPGENYGGGGGGGNETTGAAGAPGCILVLEFA